MSKPSQTPNSPQVPIREIRQQRVLLDFELASIYGVTTKSLNQAAKRNSRRFPEDFRWQLTDDEWRKIRALENEAIKAASPNRSQNVTGSQRHRASRIPPFAFTEHGALQAANVLKSERAAAMSVFVIRAFVQLREQMLANAYIQRRLSEIDKALLQHDAALQALWTHLQPLLSPQGEAPKRRIGFKP